jgi:type VI secretion system protein ImpE
MTAKELFDQGKLAAAITQLNAEVKSHPTDARLRTFLFELLCFAGDYQRADRQLEVLGQQGTSAEVGVQIYRKVLTAEQARLRLFSHSLKPHFLFSPPAYAALHLQAINRLRENRAIEARSLLEQAAEERPNVHGAINGQSFTDIQDSDVLIGPFLEAVVQGEYTWLPFTQIKHLRTDSPKRLRDLLWMQAILETFDGPKGEVFLPILYPGSATHADDQVKLGRMTDWQPIGEGLSRGFGQRLLLVDDEEHPILEIRELECEVV